MYKLIDLDTGKIVFGQKTIELAEARAQVEGFKDYEIWDSLDICVAWRIPNDAKLRLNHNQKE